MNQIRQQKFEDAKRKGLVEFKNEFKDIIKEENVVLD